MGDSKSGGKERTAPVPPPSNGERVWVHTASPPSTVHIPRRSDAGGCLCVVFLQSPASSICSPQPSRCGSLQRSQKRATIFFSLAAPMASRATQSEEEPASHRAVSPLGPHPALSPLKLTLRERRAELPPSPNKKTVHCLPFFHELLPTIVPA